MNIFFEALIVYLFVVVVVVVVVAVVVVIIFVIVVVVVVVVVVAVLVLIFNYIMPSLVFRKLAASMSNRLKLNQTTSFQQA